jgi:hypothetical protein
MSALVILAMKKLSSSRRTVLATHAKKILILILPLIHASKILAMILNISRRTVDASNAKKDHIHGPTRLSEVAYVNAHTALLKTTSALALMDRCLIMDGADKEAADGEDTEEFTLGEDNFQSTHMFTLMKTRPPVATSLTQSTTSPLPDGMMVPTKKPKNGHAHVTWKSSLLELQTSTRLLNRLLNLWLNNKRRPIMTTMSLSWLTQNQSLL